MKITHFCFYFFASLYQNIYCGHAKEPAQRDYSDKCLQHTHNYVRLRNGVKFQRFYKPISSLSVVYKKLLKGSIKLYI